MRSLTLEVSLKPFYGLDDDATLDTCRAALRQWRAIVDQADSLSIMFWAADGSEILEYGGDLDSPMEWARYLGNANPHMPVPADPEQKSLHARNYLYRDDATEITYRRYREVVEAWRAAAGEIGKEIRTGATFDPGGEFSPSAFKYQRHREICLSNTMGKASFVCCYANLHAETHRYAGFPDGIEEGTSLGTFLGGQFSRFAEDLGFDFIWFSNGFGFGMETWKTVGPLFDGETFHPERAGELSERVLRFWRDFRRECPDLGIRTRGTNLGTGSDLASDATPLRELYSGGFAFDPPPNSPWASINGDFGIELAGYQSRIAELPPGRGFPFRFYLHDPWWLNSPWIDRYEEQPHDIYLPLSIGRVAEDGALQSADDMLLFSIDDSYGKMPDRVPNESIPHLLRAWKERPDAPGPLVWLYPFDELHDNLASGSPDPGRLFHNDWFAREILNGGVPLNTVVSTRVFDGLGNSVHAALAGRVLIAPAPFSEADESRLLNWIAGGGDVIVYGPLDHAPVLRERLGLVRADPLDGTFAVRCNEAELDTFLTDRPESYRHRTVMSGGALREAEVNPGSCLAIAERDGAARALAAEYVAESGARVSWLRAPLPLAVSTEEHLPTPDSPESSFPFHDLVRQTLARHGWKIAFKADTRTQRGSVVTIHRQDNGWFFSGFTPDTTVAVAVETPYGAPLLIGTETRLKDRIAHYHFPRAWRRECRVFLDQSSGVASCVESCPAQVGVTRRLWIRGLNNARIRFFPPTGFSDITFWDNPDWPHIGGNKLPFETVETPQGPLLQTTLPASGTVLLSW